MLGEIAAFTAFRHPGLDVGDPEALALPLAEIYVAGADRRRVVLVRPPAPADRGARPARARTCAPSATVKPKDVPALVEHLWRVQTAVQAIARAGRRRSRA